MVISKVYQGVETEIQIEYTLVRLLFISRVYQGVETEIQIEYTG